MVMDGGDGDGGDDGDGDGDEDQVKINLSTLSDSPPTHLVPSFQSIVYSINGRKGGGWGGVCGYLGVKHLGISPPPQKKKKY